MLLIALALIVAAAGIGAWVYYDKVRGGQAAAQPQGKPGKGRGGKGGDGGPIPVVAGVAQVGEIPIYLSGLGTVVPMRTVIVRSRVDGELVRVNFTEGQYVKEGEVLAQVDPRPFQVQLDQAEGQLVKDQALLANARIDLERYRTLVQQDSIAKQQVDTQAALVRQYEGTVRQVDQGAGRQRAAAARLHPHHRADQRPRSGCARSIPATSCTPPTRAGWS